MIKFTVQGIPVPQGSMFALMPKGGKRPIVISANKKLAQWRKTVHAAAIEAMGFGHPAGKKVALRVVLRFFMPQARTNKDIDAVVHPDLDKLVRAVLDGMTKVVYEDDAQIVEIHAFKTFGNPRAEIDVEEIGLSPALPVQNRDEIDELPF